MKKILSICVIIFLIQNESIAQVETTDSNGVVHIEVMPEYRGGEEAFVKFLDSNLTYPLLAKEQGIQGTVWMSFSIDSTGKVVDAMVKRGIGGGCDEEALRVVELMPDWIPGTVDGRPVKAKYMFPINFKFIDDGPPIKKKKKKTN